MYLLQRVGQLLQRAEFNLTSNLRQRTQAVRQGVAVELDRCFRLAHRQVIADIQQQVDAFGQEDRHQVGAVRSVKLATRSLACHQALLMQLLQALQEVVGAGNRCMRVRRQLLQTLFKQGYCIGQQVDQCGVG